ncbi:hypothetical protein AA313_de0201544 [Arthrobotrys entomopaga]|nr:hypothetical protein AA313_de0201544 [Arthrobotrys entomopaga]
MAALPHFLQLPVELTSIIGRDVDDEDDLLALRLTCRSFNAKFHDAHIQRIYERRYVYFMPASLENLIKISESEMGPLVRHLEFWMKYPYIRSSDSDVLVDYSNNRLSPPKQITNQNLSSLLYKAFLKLPNIQSIAFKMGSSLRMNGKLRSVTNLFFPCAGLRPGKRLLPDGDYFFDTIPNNPWAKGSSWNAWKCVIDSALDAKLLNIEVLTSTSPVSQGSWIFRYSPSDLSGFRCTFKNLRKLEIAIYISSQWGGTTEARPFYDWVESVGASLEELCLYSTRTDRISAGFSWGQHLVPPVIELPNLKRLKLVNICVTRDDVLHLIRHPDSWNGADASECWPKDQSEDWSLILKCLRTHKYRNLQKLELILHGSYEAFSSFVVPALELTW